MPLGISLGHVCVDRVFNIVLSPPSFRASGVCCLSLVCIFLGRDMVRAANNMLSFFSAQVPVSPGRTVCLTKEKRN